LSPDSTECEQNDRKRYLARAHMNPESLQSNQKDIVLRADRDWSELSLRSICIADTRFKWAGTATIENRARGGFVNRQRLLLFTLAS
jgi:hypothetical protein